VKVTFIVQGLVCFWERISFDHLVSSGTIEWDVSAFTFKPLRGTKWKKIYR